jgi:predicted alpha/beta-hydrolase family hydrolase
VPLAGACTVFVADEPAGARLILAHGAGAGQNHPFMLAMARGLAARGIDVITFDFPYMQDGRRMPDKAPVLERCFRDVIETVRNSADPRPLFIGGKSMGGRIATHLGAQGLDDARGIVALGYPLHPPGKSQQLRDAHLPEIRMPVLIVQGERDAFGTPDELKPVLARMAADVTLHVVRGGDHSLNVGRQRAQAHDAVLDVISSWMKTMAATAAQR